LCADEPTSELDSVTADEMLALMSRLQKETGAAMVIVSHDSHVADFASRMLTMDDGILGLA
jgi:ABC-type lipoprotein export system ATPase subunit